MEEALISCPFNPYHKLKKERLATHIFRKCQYYRRIISCQMRIFTCPYSKLHLFLSYEDSIEHILNCPEKPRGAVYEINENITWGEEEPMNILDPKESRIMGMGNMVGEGADDMLYMWEEGGNEENNFSLRDEIEWGTKEKISPLNINSPRTENEEIGRKTSRENMGSKSPHTQNIYSETVGILSPREDVGRVSTMEEELGDNVCWEEIKEDFGEEVTSICGQNTHLQLIDTQEILDLFANIHL